MRPVPVFPDCVVKLVIPASRAILKPAVIYRCVSLEIPLPKNLSRKIARFFVSKISRASGVRPYGTIWLVISTTIRLKVP